MKVKNLINHLTKLGFYIVDDEFFNEDELEQYGVCTLQNDNNLNIDYINITYDDYEILGYVEIGINGKNKLVKPSKLIDVLKLYESKKSVRKSLKESRDSILDKEFYDLVEEGYIYDENENGMNMSYGEYASVSDDLWEVLEDELKRYRDFPSAYDAYVEIMDNTSDDAKMFMAGSDDDFYFSIDEDEGTYTFSGEVPFILEKLFKEFQKETDLEMA